MPKRSKQSNRTEKQSGERMKCPEPGCGAQIKLNFFDNHMELQHGVRPLTLSAESKRWLRRLIRDGVTGMPDRVLQEINSTTALTVQREHVRGERPFFYPLVQGIGEHNLADHILKPDAWKAEAERLLGES